MRATLRPVDPTDPRPSPFSEIVANAACEPHAEEMAIWLRAESRGTLDLAPDAVRFACATCLIHTKGDPWAAAKLLEKTYYWPMDLDGARLVERMTRSLGSALKAETGRWVVRANIRFPGRKGDRIEWVTPDGVEHSGTVYGVEGSQAAAIVHAGSEAVRVFAENVFGNATQGLYAAFTSGAVSPLPATERVTIPEKPIVTLRVDPYLDLPSEPA
jgi:hypothetical protein